MEIVTAAKNESQFVIQIGTKVLKRTETRGWPRPVPVEPGPMPPLIPVHFKTGIKTLNGFGPRPCFLLATE
jgi:hypothetical protein